MKLNFNQTVQAAICLILFYTSLVVRSPYCKRIAPKAWAVILKRHIKFTTMVDRTWNVLMSKPAEGDIPY